MQKEDRSSFDGDETDRSTALDTSTPIMEHKRSGHHLVLILLRPLPVRPPLSTPHPYASQHPTSPHATPCHRPDHVRKVQARCGCLFACCQQGRRPANLRRHFAPPRAALRPSVLNLSLKIRCPCRLVFLSGIYGVWLHIRGYHAVVRSVPLLR